VEGYTAPEQERGQSCTQSDLFALGPTLIFLLSGKNPMNCYGSIQGKYGFDLSQIPTIDPALQDIIAKLTEVKPSDRYQTAQEVSQALAKLQE
jgi:serine/threonine-protein kinase